MSIIITPAQVLALAQAAGEAGDSLRLHQVGEDPDVLVAWGAAAEPRLLVRADGTTEPIVARARREAERARPE